MILSHRGRTPLIAESAFVAPNATVIGEVTIGEEASLWFNVVARGDVNRITIGRRTNIQDGTVIHVTSDTHPTLVGDEVTVGHHVTLHGCTVGNLCLVGMGALILDGAVLEGENIVAAGSVVAPGTVLPRGTLAMGTPARVRRELTGEELRMLPRSAANYVQYLKDYR